MILTDERILITGAGGFIGGALANHLVGLSVRPFCLGSSLSHQKDNWRLASIKNHIHLLNIDLTDEKAVNHVIAEIKPTIIYHFAAHGAYAHQTDTDRIFKTNVLGTKHLLESLATIDYRLFVNIGTSSEYGYKSTPMKEDDELAPASSYALSKATQTALCQMHARQFNKPIVTLRLFSAYGPFEEPTRLIPTVLKALIDNMPLNMADPSIARDFVYIDDMIEAMLSIDRLILAKGEAINLASGKQSTLKDVVDCLSQIASMPLTVNWGAFPNRSWDTHCWVGDVSKAKAMLGWESKITLIDGLRKTLAWMKQHG